MLVHDPATGRPDHGPGGEPCQPAPGQSHLQTVDRALSVLLSYSDGRPDWGVMDLARAMGIDKSSAHRLLATLAAREFLVSDPATRRYRLGPAVWHMAARWDRTEGWSSIAASVLGQLVARTGRTALFCVPDGIHVRCVAAVEGPIVLRTHKILGELYPVNAGATSRAYFAFLPPEERKLLLAGRVLASFTRLTKTSADAIGRDMELTARHGFAESEGEYDAATRALAVPVWYGHRPIGSLSLTEGKDVAYAEPLHRHVVLLRSAVDLLSRRLAENTTPVLRAPATPNVRRCS